MGAIGYMGLPCLLRIDACGVGSAVPSLLLDGTIDVLKAFITNTSQWSEQRHSFCLAQLLLSLYGLFNIKHI
jgi:hypothetical protein